jgi:hypothetical protein
MVISGSCGGEILKYYREAADIAQGWDLSPKSKKLNLF